MTYPVVHVQFREDGDAFAFGDYASRQPDVLGVSLTHPDTPEGAPAEPRFITNPVTVSGNFPAELEARALAHFAEATGWPDPQLRVRTPYCVNEVPPGQPGVVRSGEQQDAAAQKHRLYAGIAVEAFGPAPQEQEGKDA
jgi:hypothetical protein